jgi:alpha-N-acetylglucosaminidase
MRDLGDLVGTREEFVLGRWVDEARRWATTPAERDLYEWNARNDHHAVGHEVHGGEEDDLNLYAHKQWQGMFTSYYLPRWQEFFAGLNRAVDAGTSFDRAPFAAAMCRWEQDWSRRHDAFPTRPRGDALAVAQRLYSKYRHQLEALR